MQEAGIRIPAGTLYNSWNGRKQPCSEFGDDKRESRKSKGRCICILTLSPEYIIFDSKGVRAKLAKCEES